MREASVAPQERVNIVYKPATGDLKAEAELPLKLLMIGDYTLRPDEQPLEERKPINIDKDTFNEVMRNQKLSLTINVDDRLSDEEGAKLPVTLEFETLKAFEPEAIVRQVPELNKLLQLRMALQVLKGPLGNFPAFRKRIEALLKDESTRERMLEELGMALVQGEASISR